MAREFAQGDHVCALYESEAEQLTTAARYVAEGLREGERCLFVGSSPEALDRFRAALGSLQIDVADMIRRGALVQATNAEVHLDGGRFDSERMLHMLNDAVEEALNDGFKGLRTCGDMSWLLDEPDGSEQVVEYEAHLNQFFRGVRALGMCLFDRKRLPPLLLDHALATHASVAIDGRHMPNPYYDPLPTRVAQVGHVAARIGELRRLR